MTGRSVPSVGERIWYGVPFAMAALLVAALIVGPDRFGWLALLLSLSGSLLWVLAEAERP